MSTDRHTEARELLGRLRRISTLALPAARLGESELAELRRAVPELQAGVLDLSRALEERQGPDEQLRAALPTCLAREIDGLAQALDQPEDESNRDGGIASKAGARAVRHLLRAEALAETLSEGFAPPAVAGRTAAPAPEPSLPRGERPPAPGHAPGPLGKPARAGPPGQPRELATQEVEAFLRAQRWGVLSTVEDGKSYAVPVIYGFDGRRFYFVSGPGRKVTNLRANPAVCLTVAEVAEDGSSWTSAVAMGEAHVVDDLTGRITAFRVLRRQRRGAPSRRIADAARLARANVFRIEPDALTGRALDSSPTGRH